MNEYESDNPTVHQAYQDNVVAMFISNYFEELDKQIEEPCIKVMHLYGTAQRFWLDGASSLHPDCFRKMCSILKIELTPEEEQIARSVPADHIAATNFFQSTVKNEQPMHEHYLHGAGPDQEYPSQQNMENLSYAQMHPELGLSVEDYENYANNSYLKGSMGVYLKVIYSKQDPKFRIHLDKHMVPKIDGHGAEYPTIFPVEYYKNLVDKERAKNDNEKWYLRPHHIETLTEHPLSLRDNLLDSNYYSFYSEMYKDKDGRYLTPAEVAAMRAPNQKEMLINSLEESLVELRKKMMNIPLGKRPQSGAGLIPVHEIQNYYRIGDNKKDVDTSALAFDTVMDQLRNQEKELLNRKRGQEALQYGVPDKDWYTSKSPSFTREMKKFDRLNKADPHRDEKVRQLMSKELY